MNECRACGRPMPGGPICWRCGIGWCRVCQGPTGSTLRTVCNVCVLTDAVPPDVWAILDANTGPWVSGAEILTRGHLLRKAMITDSTGWASVDQLLGGVTKETRPIHGLMVRWSQIMATHTLRIHGRDGKVSVSSSGCSASQSFRSMVSRIRTMGFPSVLLRGRFRVGKREVRTELFAERGDGLGLNEMSGDGGHACL